MLVFTQLVNPSLTEPEGSKSCSQEPACFERINIVHPVILVKTHWKSPGDYTRSPVKEHYHFISMILSTVTKFCAYRQILKCTLSIFIT
jgi:hypothetical protein